MQPDSGRSANGIRGRSVLRQLMENHPFLHEEFGSAWENACSEPMDIDLQRCINGEKDAWDHLVKRVAPIVYVAVRRVIIPRSPQAADGTLEDVAQDVFLRLVKDDYRLLRTFDPGRSSFPTWLTVVSRSAAIDHLRKRRLETIEPEQIERHSPVSSPPTPSLLEVPLNVLTARQRLVLRLLFDQEMSVPEAASMLGVYEQTVRSTKHKAITRLREHMIPKK